MMNKPKSVPHRPSLNKEVRLRLGQQLRAYYDTVILEELPAPLALLMMRLKAKEGGAVK
jgi:hypothetical protein